MKEMYDSFNFTSGTKKAKPTISFLYIATQLKSGYWRLSVTKMKRNIDENYIRYRTWTRHTRTITNLWRDVII